MTHLPTAVYFVEKNPQDIEWHPRYERDGRGVKPLMYGHCAFDVDAKSTRHQPYLNAIR